MNRKGQEMRELKGQNENRYGRFIMKIELLFIFSYLSLYPSFLISNVNSQYIF